MGKAEFGRTAEDYAAHRAGFPESFFDRLLPFGIGLPGQDIVDMGTGTGTLARGFARRGCAVTGIDLDAEMLVQAGIMAEQEGVTVDFKQGTAEATRLEDNCCDVVSAGQCWHWFDPNRAIPEILRILRPGGLLLIGHFDWLTLKGNVVEMTEALILEHCPEWKGAGGMGLYPWWLKQLGDVGIEGMETFSYDVAQVYSQEAWRGRIQASAGIASLSPGARNAFDKAFAVELKKFSGEEDLAIPHRVFGLIARP
jgi:SAM-dependent methyltransferase